MSIFQLLSFKTISVKQISGYRSLPTVFRPGGDGLMTGDFGGSYLFLRAAQLRRSVSLLGGLKHQHAVVKQVEKLNLYLYDQTYAVSEGSLVQTLHSQLARKMQAHWRMHGGFLGPPTHGWQFSRGFLIKITPGTILNLYFYFQIYKLSGWSWAITHFSLQHDITPKRKTCQPWPVIESHGGRGVHAVQLRTKNAWRNKHLQWNTHYLKQHSYLKNKQWHIIKWHHCIMSSPVKTNSGIHTLLAHQDFC